MEDLFELPSDQVRKSFEKAGAYDESKHPRDKGGRWTAGGAARAALGAGAAIGAGVLAVRHPAAAGRLVGNVIGAARHAINNPEAAGAAVGAGARRASMLAGVQGARAAAYTRHTLATAPKTLGTAVGNTIGATRRAVIGAEGDFRQGQRIGRRLATRTSAMFGGRTTGLGGRRFR